MTTPKITDLITTELDVQRQTGVDIFCAYNPDEDHLSFSWSGRSGPQIFRARHSSRGRPHLDDYKQLIVTIKLTV